jgi:hypothetical protein
MFNRPILRIWHRADKKRPDLYVCDQRLKVTGNATVCLVAERTNAMGRCNFS